MATGATQFVVQDALEMRWSFQGSWTGSLTARTLIAFPSTTIASSRASTVASNLPRIESYFNRWASVLALVIVKPTPFPSSRHPIPTGKEGAK